MTGWPDHRLMQIVLDDDWTSVTRNSDDFRPRPGSASQAPCYLGQPLHGGRICLSLPAGLGRAEQTVYFEAVLGQIGLPGDPGCAVFSGASRFIRTAVAINAMAVTIYSGVAGPQILWVATIWA